MPEYKPCKSCKHFRQDWTFYLFALFPVVGWIMFPWLRKSAIEFGKCDKFRKEEYFPDPGTRHFASVAREWNCKGNAWESKNA